MSRYSYKITDINALEKAYPDAVHVVKTPNRVEIGQLWRAATKLGATIPGIEAVETDDMLESIPKHTADTKADND